MANIVNEYYKYPQICVHLSPAGVSPYADKKGYKRLKNRVKFGNTALLTYLCIEKIKSPLVGQSH